jgi:hypothetical protein
MDTEQKIEPIAAAPASAAPQTAESPASAGTEGAAAAKAAADSAAVRPSEMTATAAETPVIAPDVRADASAADHSKTAAVRMPWKSNRFAVLAATIAVAAGLGSIAGAAGFSGMARLMASPEAKPAPAPQVVRVDNAAEMKSLRETAAQLRTGFKQLNDNVNALRASLEGSGKGASPQIAKLNDAVAKLSEAVERQERGHAEAAQRIAKTTDALEKRAGVPTNAPDVTGSIAKSRAAEAKTDSLRPPAPPIVTGWNLRRVIGGGDLAIIEGPDRVIEVEPGDTIRGVGRVHDIKKMDGRWAILTASGLIVSRR